MDIKVDPLIFDLVQPYLDRIARELPEARADLQAGRLDALRRFAHNLSGTGGSFGLTTVSQNGQAIERAVLDGDTSGVVELLDEIEQVVNEANVVPDNG